MMTGNRRVVYECLKETSTPSGVFVESCRSILAMKTEIYGKRDYDVRFVKGEWCTFGDSTGECPSRIGSVRCHL